MGYALLSRASVIAGAMLVLAACEPAPSDTSSTATAENHYNTRLDMQQLMTLVLEPAADMLWDSGGWILDAAGYQELYPTTDAGWDHVRAQAAIVVEAGNSLALPGRAEDNAAWLIYSRGLSEAGIVAMEAAAARDKEAFFQAGAQLYSVCTACHQAYSPAIVDRFADDPEN